MDDTACPDLSVCVLTLSSSVTSMPEGSNLENVFLVQFAYRERGESLSTLLPYCGNPYASSRHKSAALSLNVCRKIFSSWIHINKHRYRRCILIVPLVPLRSFILLFGISVFMSQLPSSWGEGLIDIITLKNLYCNGHHKIFRTHVFS